MNNDDRRISELTVALANAERRLAEHATLITAAIGQTETARSQYEQANERAETLRRRLDEKEERLSAIQKELQQRDSRIAALEQQCAENDNALSAINRDVKRRNLANPNERLATMGLVLESLDEPGVQHKIVKVTTTLGRSNGNDIAINSISASRYHARIVVEPDGIDLIDLQSTNGCSVNGKRVSRQTLSDRDVIAIGNTKFKLSVGAPLTKGEDRSMDETYPLLDDAVIFSAPSKSRSNTAHAQAAEPKDKNQK